MLSINPKVPLALAFISGLAMLGATAWQGYSFWQSQNQQTAPGNNSASQPLTEKRSSPTLALASLEFFGTAQPDGIQTQQSTEDLPETNLKIFLRGVLAADGDFPGSALIEDDKRNTDVFIVGDELPGNAKLRSVHSNRVILDRSGKLENLYFPETDNDSGMSFSSDADNLQQTSAVQRPESAVTQKPTQSRQPAANDQQRREDIRQRLEQLRERLRTNG
ncbi:type II secretion system protein N [Marinobacter sp.]|uniref:type II secretion system protein N n=1 Tax=Marinobacter sp. TaxID=50741 RepID=UPI001B62437B|nr:type II secretion system protein N [Marinobacter sp.]MBQ0831947.1 general secretion pathway protein GspC [Marinobacter sp.]